MKYILNPNAQILFDGQNVLNIKQVVDAINIANNALKHSMRLLKSLT